MTGANEQQFTTWKTSWINKKLQQKQTLMRHEVKDVLRAVEEVNNHGDVLPIYVFPLVLNNKRQSGLLFEFVMQLHAIMNGRKVDKISYLPVLTETLSLIGLEFAVQEQHDPIGYGQRNTSRPYGHYDRGPEIALNAGEMMRLVRLTVDLNRGDLVPLLLDRINDTSKTLTQAQQELIMLPFLQDLLKTAKEKGLDWNTAPFHRLFTDTLKRYISTSLRPEPPLAQQIEPRQVGCGCVRCQKLDAFLRNEDAKEESFREYVKERRHLEDRLQRVQTKNLIHWHSRREGKGPEVLRVSKADGNHEYKQWVLQRAKFRDRVKSVASWQDLRILLGNSFAEVMCTTKLIPRLKFSDHLPASLPVLNEPERTKRWLSECYVADEATAMTQQELWQIYNVTMDAVPPDRTKLSATEFLQLVPQVIMGTRSVQSTPQIVKGIRPWTRNRDSSKGTDLQARTSETRPPLGPVANARGGTTGTFPQTDTTANPLKRKIDVVDLCDSD